MAILFSKDDLVTSGNRYRHAGNWLLVFITYQPLQVKVLPQGIGKQGNKENKYANKLLHASKNRHLSVGVIWLSALQ